VISVHRSAGVGSPPIPQTTPGPHGPCPSQEGNCLTIFILGRAALRHDEGLQQISEAILYAMTYIRFEAAASGGGLAKQSSLI